ncbi:GNAT family N-acetyltransferase [Sphingomonas sp. MMS12-HWE2-04]|uniref:GNAT family N-acetyltransferase n=1 Tax=Sphingomonas sp. MMS12-HWE2-04 TaxID=3234199 RepID=UPI00385024F6
MERTALPPFPRSLATAAIPSDAPRLHLRPAGADDLARLTQLHAALRLPELALAPWSAAEKQTFLDDQFRLQHLHFVTHHAKADFWVVTDSAGTTIGRLYLDRSRRDWRILEILLAADVRGQGLGSLLLAWVQQRAIAAGAEGVALNVTANNPRAQALYQRFRFEAGESDDGFNLPMRWRADGPLC